MRTSKYGRLIVNIHGLPHRNENDFKIKIKKGDTIDVIRPLDVIKSLSRQEMNKNGESEKRIPQ
jgi:hypothetical protein